MQNTIYGMALLNVKTLMIFFRRTAMCLKIDKLAVVGWKWLVI